MSFGFFASYQDLTRRLWLCCFLCSLAQIAVGAEPVSAETRRLLEQFVSEFVPISPGKAGFPATFQMGTPEGATTEQPVVEVTLTAPFSIARYEMTQNLYEAVTGRNPSRWKGPRNSVEMLSWSEANACCQRLTLLLKQEQLIAADEEIRLPTEAEWEYCCRAGTTTQFSFGDAAQADSDVAPEATLLDPYGWHTGNAAGNDPPVGALKPNPWGLYDMHGYLAEFCADDWIANHATHSQTVSARSAAEASPQCVIRSGSWKDRSPDLRSAARKPFSKQQRDDAVGFRCVRQKIPASR